MSHAARDIKNGDVVHGFGKGGGFFGASKAGRHWEKPTRDGKPRSPKGTPSSPRKK